MAPHRPDTAVERTPIWPLFNTTPPSAVPVSARQGCTSRGSDRGRFRGRPTHPSHRRAGSRPSHLSVVSPMSAGDRETSDASQRGSSVTRAPLTLFRSSTEASTYSFFSSPVGGDNRIVVGLVAILGRGLDSVPDRRRQHLFYLSGLVLLQRFCRKNLLIRPSVLQWRPQYHSTEECA